MQPYGMVKDVLIEFQDSSTLVDFMVVDMDPRQQTSIILGDPFLRSVNATINKAKGTINMNVDGVQEKFIYHPENLACCCQIRVHRYPGSRKVKCVEVLPEHMKSRVRSRNKRPEKRTTTTKKPDAAENFSRRVNDATPAATSSPVATAT
jgi:hypothetical protein